MKSSNISLNRRLLWCWPVTCLLAGLMTAGFFNTAQAIDPHRAMSQYMCDQWGSEKGYPGGAVNAITQTADGYLWIGSEKGLVRFDGSTFRLVQRSGRPSSPLAPVFGLAADGEGSLWIRLQGPMLLCYRHGELDQVIPNRNIPDSIVTAMCRGRDGTLLLSALGSGLMACRGGQFKTLVSPDESPKPFVISMAETPGGDIWMGTRDAGLFRSNGGQTALITKGLPDRKINCLLPGSDPELWVGTDNGMVRWNGTEITKSGVPTALGNIQALAMARDRQSNIWIGTGSHGLLRLNASGVSSLDERGQRSRGAVTALFEDREGNLWVGSSRGIEQLRDTAFVTYSVSEGLPSESNGPVYVDSEERTWFAPSDGGLYWMKGGSVRSVTDAGLARDVVYSIAGNKGELWAGRQRGGLTRLRYKGGSFLARTFTQANGLAQNSVYAVHQNRDGTVWAATLSRGVSRFRNGSFTTYTTANGLASNTVTSIMESSNGTMWFATPNGLNSLSEGRWQVYTVQDGLPSENVNCLLEDSAGILWIGTAGGLCFLSSNSRVQVPRQAPESLNEEIFGIAEDGRGWLWIATSNHVLRAKSDQLLSGAPGDGDVREYGIVDGLRGVEGVKRHRSVVADPLGRIWFSMTRGLSVVDPTRVAVSSVPALVHLQTISADGRAIDLRGPVRIPAGRQRIILGFAALNLSVPERVRFRFTLEGFDHGWSEPVARPEAIYTNLRPGSYRFRVMATNSEGLWNTGEAAIGFDVEPAYWQTWWFRLSGVLACSFTVLAVYRYRLHQLTKQLNVRFEERLAERTRIAQELHDTLLQGFLSASMQLQVAAHQVPADSPAKPLLGRVVQLMGDVIEEGRNAVRGLRAFPGSSQDLEQAFSRVPQDLAVHDPIDFRVIVEGRRRPLQPLIRDEVYRIGREALVNAFRHSRARNIEIELEHAAKQLRVLVRDNGCGIDPQVLSTGREGHWGLPGMRERAERIGARLRVWSRAAAGTEVELSVPSHIAFQYQSSDRWLRWLARWYPEKTRTDITESRKGGI